MVIFQHHIVARAKSFDIVVMLKKIISNMTSTNYWIIIAAIGIWLIALQNFGVFGKKLQKVYVVGGYIDANVTGYVDIENTVDVNVENTVDVNLEYINGHSDVFFNNPRRGDNNKYYRIPVVTE